MTTTTIPSRPGRPLRARPIDEPSPPPGRPHRRARFRRRLGATAVAALAVLLVAEVTARGLENRLPPRAGWISDEYPLKLDRMDELAGDGGAGVALLGSSVVDVSVDPAGLGDAATGGRGAYNAGLIGATPVIVETWSSEVVTRLRPDVAVVAISSRDLNGNGSGMRFSDQLFRQSPGGRHLLGTESFADEIEWWLTEHSALLRHRQSLRRPLEALGDYDPPDRNSTELTDLGLETHLLDVAYRGDETARSFFRREPLRDWAVTDDQLTAFRTLVRALVDDGIRVVVLDVPVTDDYIALHPGGAADMTAYTAVVDDVVADAGAELLRPGVWAPDLFSDPLHLNGRGVDRLTAELDGYLASR